MGLFGKILGNIAGGLGGKILPLPGVNGGEVGSAIGSLLPFSNGGKIPGKRGKAKIILGHSGEYILPLNARPTKGQIAIVKRNKAKKNKK